MAVTVSNVWSTKNSWERWLYWTCPRKRRLVSHHQSANKITKNWGQQPWSIAQGLYSSNEAIDTQWFLLNALFVYRRLEPGHGPRIHALSSIAVFACGGWNGCSSTCHYYRAFIWFLDEPWIMFLVRRSHEKIGEKGEEKKGMRDDG